MSNFLNSKKEALAKGDASKATAPKPAAPAEAKVVAAAPTLAKPAFQPPNAGRPAPQQAFQPRPPVQQSQGTFFPPGTKLPELDELVVCRCTKILQYGAFFELVEYPGVEGFCHISEVSSGWVKNIYSAISKGQLYVAKIVRLNTAIGEINVSIKRVSEGAKKERLQEWQFEKRARALFGVICQKAGVKEPEAFEKIAVPLIAEHGTLFKALQAIRFTPKESMPPGLSEKFQNALTEVLEKSIEVPQKTVRGILKLKSGESNGVEVIRKSLTAAEAALKGEEFRLSSDGAPKYAISVTTPNFKQSEKLLNKAVQAVEEEMKRHKNSTFEFERLKD